MINHFRTLLLNKEASKCVGEASEIIPETFAPVQTTNAIAAVHKVLFGANPDANTLNTRAHQYLSVIDATDLKDYPAQLDPRITYDLQKNLSFYKNYGVEVRRLNGTVGELVLLDTDKYPENNGRTELTWRVAIDAADVLIADHFGHDLPTQTASLSTIYTLPNTALKFRLGTTEDSSAWFIRQVSPPAAHLSSVYASLRNMGVYAEQILEPATAEPFKTFRNVWRDHPAAPFKLAALICGVVYRLEQTRVQNA